MFLDFKREPFDLDILVEDMNHAATVRKEYADYPRVEFHVIPPLWEYLRNNELTSDVLLTLKASHIFWPVKWDKHLHDINFMVDRGARIIRPLFYELYNMWVSERGVGHRSNLEMSSEDFFDNALKTYDHDELHTFLNPIPTYTLVLKEGAEVDVDEAKFEALTFEQKCALVREEVYVMAFERRGKMSYGAAYFRMFKKFLMAHAPVWEAVFIMENFKHLYRPEFDYFAVIEKGLKKTKTRKHGLQTV